MRGYLVSVQAGSGAKRFVIGFGAGSSEIVYGRGRLRDDARGLKESWIRDA